VGEQLRDHRQAREVIARVLAVVKGLCEPGGPVVAGGGDGKQPGCSDAARLLQQAEAKYEELSEATSQYLASFEALLRAFRGKVEDAAEQQAGSLLASETARAKRAHELATAEDEEMRQKSGVRLIERARRELERSCGPHAESAEDRLQRRAEELEALKGALAVLEGQAVPVQ